MAEVIIVYWRDIPAQVIVGRGRSAAKVKLAERFEQAIDRAAMKAGMIGTDNYLSQWRRAPAVTLPGEDAAAASIAAARIEAEYDSTRLKQLIEAEGWAAKP
jgi:hypothetical protein